jgi:hypothetical protein
LPAQSASIAAFDSLTSVPSGAYARFREHCSCGGSADVDSDVATVHGVFRFRRSFFSMRQLRCPRHCARALLGALLLCDSLDVLDESPQKSTNHIRSIAWTRDSLKLICGEDGRGFSSLRREQGRLFGGAFRRLVVKFIQDFRQRARRPVETRGSTLVTTSVYSPRSWP